VDPYEPVRLGEGQGTEQQSANGAEGQRVCADAQGKRQHGGEEKPRSREEAPHREAKICHSGILSRAAAAIPRREVKRCGYHDAAPNVLPRMIQPRLGCIVALAACAFGQPKFEVASIKPCTAERPSFQRGVGNVGPQPSPGRLHLSCVTVERLIEIAYLQYADGSFRPFRTRLRIPIDSEAEWLYSAARRPPR
jgi:hypothetical protein